MATIEISDDTATLIRDIGERMGMTPAEVVQHAVLEFGEDYADPRDAQDLAMRRDSGQVRMWTEEVRYRLGLSH